METTLNDPSLFTSYPHSDECSFGPKARFTKLKGISLLLLATAGRLYAATFQVDVGNGSPSFGPDDVTIHAGDTVQWNWYGTMGHSVTSGANLTSNGLFDTGNVSAPNTFSFTF